MKICQNGYYSAEIEKLMKQKLSSLQEKLIEERHFQHKEKHRVAERT